MRVLFYVEPFPIRNSMTHFADIAKSALAIIGKDPSFDMRLYANRATIECLDESLRSKRKNDIIVPSDVDEALFASSLVEWASGGIESWLQLIQGGKQSGSYRQLWNDIWQRFPFDVIVNWGENGAVTAFSKEQGITHIAMELGCTRAPYYNSIVMDPYGTNGASLPSKLKLADLEHVTGGRKLSSHEALFGYSDNSDSLAYEKQFAPLTPQFRFQALRKDRKIAFLPLQLYDDANLLLHSSYTSLSDVVKDVVPKLVDAGYFVVIKPHPDAKHRPNALVENLLALSSISAYADFFYWCEEPSSALSNAAIFNASALVVTVNSSVGFEALYHDKVVVVLGESSYKIPDLFPTLDQTISGSFDRERYLEGIAFLRAFMLQAYLVPRSTFGDASAFYNRICLLAEVAGSGDPAVEVARAIYAAYGPAQRQHLTFAMVAGLCKNGTNEVVRPPAQPLAGNKVHDNSSQLHVDGLSSKRDPFKLQLSIRQISGFLPKAQMGAWFETVWNDTAQRRGLLLKASLVDKAYYRERYGDVSEKDPLTHFIKHGDQLGYSISSDVDLSKYASEDNAGPSDTPMRRFLHKIIFDIPWAFSSKTHSIGSEEETAIAFARETALRQSQGTKNRIAVVVHLYYRDLVPELLDYIDNIKESLDLFVTLPMWGTREIEAMVRARFPNAIILKFPNRGRDIAPFLEVLPVLIEREYIAVLKLQTKKGYYAAGRFIPRLGEAWRGLVLNALVGTPQVAERVIATFEANSRLSMVGPWDLYVSVENYPSNNGDESFWTTLNLPALSVEDCFFAGTMFWVRPKALAPLVAAGASMAAFEPETGDNDGSISHDLERYFGKLASADGYVTGALQQKADEIAFGYHPAPSTKKINQTIEDWIKIDEVKRDSDDALMW